MRRTGGAAAPGSNNKPSFNFSGGAAAGGGGGGGAVGGNAASSTTTTTMTGVAPGGGGGVDDGGGGGPARMAHRAVASDVTLQFLVSHNVYFSICWWCATVVSTFVKTGGARQDFDDIRPVMITMYLLFEPIRLYAGFAGNLQEKVPLLMGFVSLSFFIILPVYAFFWYGQEKVQPFDKALNTVSIALLAAEVLAGINATRKVLRAQSLAFYLSEASR